MFFFSLYLCQLQCQGLDGVWVVVFGVCRQVGVVFLFSLVFVFIFGYLLGFFGVGFEISLLGFVVGGQSVLGYLFFCLGDVGLLVFVG